MKELELLKYLNDRGCDTVVGLDYLDEDHWAMIRGILELPQKKAYESAKDIVYYGKDYYIQKELRDLSKRIAILENGRIL